MDGSGFVCWQGQEILLENVRTGSGGSLLCIEWVPGVNQPEREVDHPRIIIFGRVRRRILCSNYFLENTNEMR